MDFSINDFLNILIVIGKANLLVLVLIFLSYILEKTTGIRIVIDNYKWKKSPRNAFDASNRDSFIYFVVNLLWFIYYIKKDEIGFTFINIVLWTIIIFFLTKVFFRFHHKYQAIDPNKADDDFSG